MLMEKGGCCGVGGSLAAASVPPLTSCDPRALLCSERAESPANTLGPAPPPPHLLYRDSEVPVIL